MKAPAAHLVDLVSLAQQIRGLQGSLPTHCSLERACREFLYVLENKIGVRLVEETTAEEAKEQESFIRQMTQKVEG